MAINRIFFFIRILVVFYILVVIIIMNNCSNNSGYQSVTVTKKGVTFSFEYPGSYIDVNDTLNENSREKSLVSFSHTSNNSAIHDFDIRFSILVLDMLNKNASATVNEYLQAWANLTSYYEYKLIEHSSTKITGIQGELIVYSMRGLDVGGVPESHITFFRDIYLDYKKYIIHIGIYSYPELADQAAADFEHIINSFKFLD